jgi:uncharacterized protein (TIGR02246 family)
MNMRLVLALTALALGWTLPSLAQQAQPSPRTQAQPAEAAPSQQDRQQLDALASRYAEAANRHDAAAIAALFTEDGVLVSPKGVHSGRQAIEQFYRDTFNAAAVSGTALQTTALHVVGDLAWAVGQWRNNTQQGNWGAVDERRGGTWQLRMLTFNTAPPEAAVAPAPATPPAPAVGLGMPSPTTTPTISPSSPTPSSR